MLHVIALAHMALTRARGWCLDCRVARLRLAAELDRARAELSLLREEIRWFERRQAQAVARALPPYWADLFRVQVSTR